MSYRDDVEALLHEWEDSPSCKASQIINTLLEFLAEDPYWFASNIRDSDKELLNKLVNAVHESE